MAVATSVGLLLSLTAQGAEIHVSMRGADSNPGSKSAPVRTIQRAAELAQPGDTITVHKGTYREAVNPPRGGESEARRIVYRAAPREPVSIKGSEVVKGWERVQDRVWKATLPNSFFGSFNPYTNLIRGDWFDRRGRDHHTGAVYLDGDWLTEAAALNEVLLPAGQKPAWMNRPGSGYMLNVAWLRPGTAAGARIPAGACAARQGTRNAECSEGGECVGFILDGDWLRYDGVDFGAKTDRLELRVASAAEGGIVEIRLASPQGKLLGSCRVANTGGWQTWVSAEARLKTVSGRKDVCLVFRSAAPRRAGPPVLNPQLWFAQVDATNTTIWAQFEGANPNARTVEINVRRTVFYPDQPGRNFITVRGFTLQHAATQWAPPTAEQMGLIGTHWSQGWVIENNTISHSICSGIALGKHGDAYDNTSADTAEGYVKTIERAHAFRIPWRREDIGHHVVRSNVISHCEQAGIVGSLGAAFCTVSDNLIHDIHVRRLFGGAEMSGIKFHAAIDTVIRRNHIYRCCQGLWLDWMAQGTRVTGNLFHDNEDRDLFLEVDHGPYLVDNNLFLSRASLLDMSEGGAFAHNLFAGKIVNMPEPSRETPYHPAHSTAVAGLARIEGGDNRFYNNIFVGGGATAGGAPATEAKDPKWTGGWGLWVYDYRPFPLQTGGNVYYEGARPSVTETSPAVLPEHRPGLRLVQGPQGWDLRFAPGKALRSAKTVRVNTERLGRARVPQLPYVNPDNSPLEVGLDRTGRRRSAEQPTPGPFEKPGASVVSLRVW